MYKAIQLGPVISQLSMPERSKAGKDTQIPQQRKRQGRFCIDFGPGYHHLALTRHSANICGKERAGM
jgi:hypothetical protein